MTALPVDVELFRELIAARLGLAFDETRTGTLTELLVRRSAAAGLDGHDYVSRLRGDVSFAKRELRLVARDVTVGETYFFRDTDQLNAFREQVLTDLAKRDGRVRILSAGCASGEEPYTLAMIARERAGLDVNIRAVDLNPAALEKAARRRYSSWSLREIPPQARHSWFRREGADFVLDAELASLVAFEERNIADGDAALFEPGSFDVVFCRNVLMYFVPEKAKDVVAWLARSLIPGGYLFLGHAENLRGISTEFHLRHTHGTFYYQRRGPEERPSEPSLERHPPVPARDESWVDIIREATQRVHAMTEPVSGTAAPHAAGEVDLSVAMDLVRRERFADAVAVVHALPTAGVDRDALLLRSILQVQTSDLAAAERTCAELLGVDEMNAGAHYVIALCREAVGDRAAATEHDRIASYLDPSFAMPWFHLGLLAQRDEDRELARAAFGRALVLLEQEDAARILLFGGGFGREALVAMCRSELRRLDRR